MNMDALTPMPAQPASANRIASGPESNAAKNLQLGQVLFGKVLRVYQDGSYLVELNGRQHVVDSAIPLRQDEVFRGRIVGLEERVVLEKIADADTPSPGGNEPDLQTDILDARLADEVKAFVNRHQGAFSMHAWNELIRSAGRTPQPQAVLAAAVFLQKLEMPFNVVRKLKTLLPHDALHLAADASTAQSATGIAQTVRILADHLREKAEDALDHAQHILWQSGLRLPVDSAIDPSLFQVVATILVHVFAVNEKMKGPHHA